MSDQHQCMGIIEAGNKTMICACVSQQMYLLMSKHFREELIREVQAFASEYHHHIDNRDVVIVEQLLDFLRSPEQET